MAHPNRASNLRAVLGGLVLTFAILVANMGFAADEGYESEVASWKSYEDVAAWLQQNYQFDKERQRQVVAVLKESGPVNVPTRKPQSLFTLHSGYCRDSAAFAKDALNRISPQYAARLVFIKNRFGQPNHWVTGFTVDGKLFVMDYGAGPEWRAMMGVHGPYDTLDEYTQFLVSLKIQRFAPELVAWRDFPGRED